jgi:hypothetical protein
MTHKVINHETFQITGRGTVFVVYRDQLENAVSQGDIMEIPDGTKWLVRDIEHYKGSMGYVSPTIGLLVKQIKDEV